jgi:hypothetical protein
MCLGRSKWRCEREAERVGSSGSATDFGPDRNHHENRENSDSTQKPASLEMTGIAIQNRGLSSGAINIQK